MGELRLLLAEYKWLSRALGPPDSHANGQANGWANGQANWHVGLPPSGEGDALSSG